MDIRSTVTAVAAALCLIIGRPGSAVEFPGASPAALGAGQSHAWEAPGHVGLAVGRSDKPVKRPSTVRKSTTAKANSTAKIASKAAAGYARKPAWQSPIPKKPVAPSAAKPKPKKVVTAGSGTGTNAQGGGQGSQPSHSTGNGTTIGPGHDSSPGAEHDSSSALEHDSDAGTQHGGSQNLPGNANDTKPDPIQTSQSDNVGPHDPAHESDRSDDAGKDHESGQSMAGSETGEDRHDGPSAGENREHDAIADTGDDAGDDGGHHEGGGIDPEVLYAVCTDLERARGECEKVPQDPLPMQDAAVDPDIPVNGNSVPEPGTLAMLAMVVLVGAGRRLRRTAAS